jgi:fatty acid desaturase
MNTILPFKQPKSLQDAELKQQLQELRRTNNVTNWYYIARTYVYLAVVIGVAVAAVEYIAASGGTWWWNVPVAMLAIVFVGAGQHQLTGLAHEGAHHILFRNRWLNELASDWLCMFPMFSTTHHYRLQHLAHHQFVNDPERDPDVSQLQTSGHWLSFPIARVKFLLTLVKQLWVPNLIRYMRVRAKYNSVPSEKNPYIAKDWRPSKVPVRLGILYMLGLVAILTALVYLGNPLWLAVVPVAWWIGMLIAFSRVPARLFSRSRIHPVISPRSMTFARLTFATLLFMSLAWITHLTGRPAAIYFALFWVVPIFTSFSFFMVLRQLVQHGNGDRGWLTNTRIFFVHPLINFAVFPVGQDYHLPHHLFATVPHYRLPQLHQLLLEYPEYRQDAAIVEGYFLPRHRPPTHPTVLDVLESGNAGAETRAIYIDDSVLEFETMDEPADAEVRT